ncbi:MAG: sugar ABC transporter ATP-binding protein [Synergistaceae bacterium]|nr:sugar ABC transporter ATP-binding protein [Synergistaceae bacterium]
MSDKPLLKLENIGKEYYGNRVLSNVNFELKAGEILGLVGENGAGKSTLMNILFGMPVIASTGGYTGKVLMDGELVKFISPTQALAAGIGMVHQEFSLIPGFSAAENILLNREVLNPSLLEYIFSDRMSTLDRAAMKARADTAIKTLGVDISPDMIVAEMPVGYKQFIEIAREIDRRNTRLLFLDEPTAVLTETEAEILLKALKSLAEKGIAIVFISHRLHEVKELCDRIVVLRDGEVIQDTDAKTATVRQIASWMVGRTVSEERHESKPQHPRVVYDDIALSVKNLWVDMPGETVRDVSFEVKRGEIFGIGGLAGHGKLGIPNGIMGLYPAGGTVNLFNTKLQLNKPRKALDNKMAFVSEDRRGVGLLLDERIDWNITFTAMQVQGKFLKGIKGLLQLRDDEAMEDAANSLIKLLDIKCTGPGQHAGELSGGNQQKVCLAKAFVLEPEILLVCEPTRGIDVGAKTLVLDALRAYNEGHGTTIIVTSSELEELRSICDRIAIVGESKIAGVLPADSPAEDFGMLMMGNSVEDIEREKEKAAS